MFEPDPQTKSKESRTRGRNGPENGDFRLFLQRELVRRCQANPKYSLRAFARFLGIDGSRLSKILRGERPVNLKLLSQFGLKLGLKPLEIRKFHTSGLLRKHGVEATPMISSMSYLQLSQDTFETIEDWRHYAILELMKVRGFKCDAKWIADALGITVSESRCYVERLQRVGLLKVAKDGGWTDRTGGFSTHVLSENETTHAHRRSQRKILEQAIQALESVPIERRDQSSMMMATHSSRIAEAKRMIRDFRRSLCEFLEAAENKDTVYQLSLSLFPLAEPQGEQTGTRGEV